jgi:hypothetical protein
MHGHTYLKLFSTFKLFLKTKTWFIGRKDEDEKTYICWWFSRIFPLLRRVEGEFVVIYICEDWEEWMYKPFINEISNNICPKSSALILSVAVSSH